MTAYSATDDYVLLAAVTAVGASEPIRITEHPMTTFQITTDGGAVLTVILEASLKENPTVDDDWFELVTLGYTTDRVDGVTDADDAIAWLRARVAAYTSGNVTVEYRHGERR